MRPVRVSELSAVCGGLLLRRSPLRELAVLDHDVARGLVRVWLISVEQLARAIVLQQFGLPLLACGWDHKDSVLTDDETWVLVQVGWYQDCADVAARLGFSSTKEFAVTLEARWRCLVSQLALSPPQDIKASWERSIETCRGLLA